MDHRDPGPDVEGDLVTALRDLLNAWDPIGVIEHGAPHDEYDCLISPILDLLERGAEAPELAAFLRSELADHFGMDPKFHTIGMDELSRAAVELRTRRDRA